MDLETSNLERELTNRKMREEVLKGVKAQVEERNYAEFQRELPFLLEQGYEGKVALVRDGRFLVVRDTRQDALRYYFQTFGNGYYSLYTIDTIEK